jgi:hypothetical protein
MDMDQLDLGLVGGEKVDLNSFKDFSVDDDNSDDEAVDPASSLIPAYEDLEASVASTEVSTFDTDGGTSKEFDAVFGRTEKTNGNRVLFVNVEDSLPEQKQNSSTQRGLEHINRPR